MDRQLIAYVLIVLMVAALAGLVALRRYHSHERAYLRRQRKEHAAQRRRLEALENHP